MSQDYKGKSLQHKSCRGESGNENEALLQQQHYSRYVGEVECCGGREDVGVIFGAGLLEAVQR